jgi:DNA-binding XRE family transcriptional regulator
VAVAVREFELSKVTEGGKDLAKVLREVRELRGWTQREVAERWGMTVDGYRPYEQGRRQLRLSQIKRLAEALDIPEAELAERLGMKMATDPTPESETDTVRLEMARELAALAAQELAELLGVLEGLSPSAWRETIETWKAQPLGPRRQDR